MLHRHVVLEYGISEDAFIGQCVCMFVALHAYVYSDILYSDFILEPSDEVHYGGYEKFV